MKKLIIIILVIALILFGIKYYNLDNELMKKIYVKNYSNYVEKYSKENNLDENLVYAIIKAESNFKEGAVSSSGAVGLMQLMETTADDVARKMNIDIFGVIENMSYIKCPDCDKTIKLFNGENTEKFLNDMKVDLLGELPMHRAITNYGDLDHIEEEEEIAELFDPIVEKIIAKSKKKLIL